MTATSIEKLAKLFHSDKFLRIEQLPLAEQDGWRRIEAWLKRHESLDLEIRNKSWEDSAPLSRKGWL